MTRTFATSEEWEAAIADRSPIPRHSVSKREQKRRDFYKVSERQLELDAMFGIFLATIQDIDDYLNRTNPDDIEPGRAAASTLDLHAAIILAIEVSGKYAVKSAKARSK